MKRVEGLIGKTIKLSTKTKECLGDDLRNMIIHYIILDLEKFKLVELQGNVRKNKVRMINLEVSQEISTEAISQIIRSYIS